MVLFQEVPAPVQQQHPNESFQNDDESVNSGQNQEEIKVDDQEIVEDVTQPPMDVRYYRLVKAE